MNFSGVLKPILKQLAVRAKRRRPIRPMDNTITGYSYTFLGSHPQSCCHNPVCVKNSVLIVKYCYRVWHGIKCMFPVFRSLKSCFFRLLAFGTFYALPFSVSFDQSELMVYDYIDYLVCVVLIEKIGAESNHLIVAEDPIHFFLVINKIIPISFFKPESVPCQP